MIHPPNILIVDDVEENLYFVELLIRDLDVNTIAALSGHEALQKAKGVDLALAIIDVRMPEMDGYELAFRLNEDRGEQKVPVIFLTAIHISEVELDKAYGYGAVDFILKPVEKHILQSKIKVFLNLYIQKHRIGVYANQLNAVAEELNIANALLKKSEEKYRSYIDNAPDGVFVTDNYGRFAEANDAACRIIGYSKEALLNISLNDLIAEGVIGPQYAQYFDFSEHGISSAVVEAVKKGAGLRWWSIETVKLPGDRFLSFIKDVTSRREAEILVTQTRLNYETFFNTIDNFLFVLDENGVIIHANTTVYNVLGYTPDEIIGESVLAVHPPERRDEAKKTIGEMLNGTSITCLIPLVTKAGLNIPVETRVAKGSWNGNPAIFGVSKDISDLKMSEEKFSKVFYINPSACGLTELDTGKYVEVNQAFTNLLGYTNEEVLGRTPVELGVISPEAVKVVMLTADYHGHTHNVETDLTAKNGDVKHVLLSSENYQIQEKRYKYTVVFDVTKRKQSELAVRESEQKYRMLIENLNEGIWYIDHNAITTFTNPRMAEILGYTQEEMIGKHLFEFMDSEGVVLAKANLERRANGISENHDFEFIHKSGQRIIASITTSPIMDQVGKYIGSVAAVQDITELRYDQEKIRMANNFLDSIVENIPDMILIKDANSLDYLRLNQAGQRLFGVLGEQINGRTDFDLYLGNQASEVAETDRTVLSSKEKLDISEEIVHTRHNGTRILHTRKIPILDSAGIPEYLLHISRDITDQKNAELNTKITEGKYKTILNSSPDGIVLIDLKGRITEISEIGLELFGATSRDDLIARKFMQFVFAGEKATIREIILKTLNEGLAQNVELKVLKKNQAVLATETSVTLIQDQHGEPISFMVIIRDISHRKLMETKQFHADRMANLGQMAAGIAHEINQPLNIISMVMDKVLFEADKSGILDLNFLKTKSDRIFENITRIRNIIDHIRDFSRSDNDYVLSLFDINLSVENAVSMIMEQFKHLGIKLDMKLEKGIQPILGNTFKFEQVIVNLLNNAKDAVLEKKNAQEAPCEMRVGIRSFSRRQAIVVEIEDNGTGVSKDDIDNILLPFYTTKEEGKGTGLGLSICYQIIKEMNGAINISSERNYGTKIEILLDLQQKTDR
jgi:PAS domain S-box-containing protein